MLKLLSITKGYKIICLNKEPPVPANAIYAFNHSCSLDAPIAFNLIKRHCYIVVGVQNLNPVDRSFFVMNGVVWVDRHDAGSRNNAAMQMCSLLKAGKSIVYFPEGTWNLHPAKPMLPMYWGGVNIARGTKCPIVPVCIEYYGKNACVRFGSPITVQANDDKQIKFEELTEAFSTLKWEIWERFPTVRRETLDVDWEQEVKKRLAAYPKLDYQYERSVIRKPYTEPRQVIHDLRKVVPSRASAFLYDKRNCGLKLI